MTDKPRSHFTPSHKAALQCAALVALLGAGGGCQRFASGVRDYYTKPGGTAATRAQHTQTHYDKYGNRTGTSVTRGNSQYHYDNYGNLTGTSTLPRKGAE